MVDLKKSDPLVLMMCDNGECGEYSFVQDLEENDYKCPHCGKFISKPERHLESDVSLGETIALSFVAKSKDRLKELIDFLISYKRKITVRIEGNKTPYTSRIITAVYGNIFSKAGKGDELIIAKLTPDTGNAFFKFSRRVVIQFLLRNKTCQFESEYLGESSKYPHIGLIVAFPESIEMK